MAAFLLALLGVEGAVKEAREWAKREHATLWALGTVDKTGRGW